MTTTFILILLEYLITLPNYGIYLFESYELQFYLSNLDILDLLEINYLFESLANTVLKIV